MRIIFSFLLLAALGHSSLSAQNHLKLEGLWRGTMTIGGIESTEKLRFELYLKKDGKRLRGRSYLYLNETKTLEMDVSGKLYGDRSLYLEEWKFIPRRGSQIAPAFNRKYQMIFTRSIWKSSLEGFWQEITEIPFDTRRERGRIELKKISDKDGA